MKLNDLFTLHQDEIALVESTQIFSEINKIIAAGIKHGVDKVSRGLQDYATQKLHSVKRGTVEFNIMHKILTNPSIIAKQLIKKAMDKSETNDVPTLTAADAILDDIFK